MELGKYLTNTRSTAQQVRMGKDSTSKAAYDHAQAPY